MTNAGKVNAWAQTYVMREWGLTEAEAAEWVNTVWFRESLLYRRIVLAVAMADLKAALSTPLVRLVEWLANVPRRS